MRKLLLGFIIGLSLVFGGCGIDNLLVRDPTKLETPVQKVQASIDQINATITAVARAVLSDYRADVITKEEARNYNEKLIEAINCANKAQSALSLGEELEAKDKVQLAQTLITWLETELVKAKNRGN